MTTHVGSIQMSQGLDVLPPKSGPAFPIPCGEWDLLKSEARRFSSEPWFFHTAGSVLLGSSLATGITIAVGSYDGADHVRGMVVAWAVTAVCLTSGSLSMGFAHLQRIAKKQQATDLVTQMDVIEQRYERPTE